MCRLAHRAGNQACDWVDVLDPLSGCPGSPATSAPQGLVRSRARPSSGAAAGPIPAVQFAAMELRALTGPARKSGATHVGRSAPLKPNCAPVGKRNVPGSSLLILGVRYVNSPATVLSIHCNACPTLAMIS